MRNGAQSGGDQGTKTGLAVSEEKSRTIPSKNPAIPTTEDTRAHTEDDRLDIGLPNPETYREQGAENPHTTPRVLIDFAHSIADRMEKAHDSKMEAEKLFSSLENCARSEGLPQARAICVVNAGRLAEDWPDDSANESTDDSKNNSGNDHFEKRYQKLRQELPEDVNRLVQALD